MSIVRERLESLSDEMLAVLADLLGVDGKSGSSGGGLVAWIEADHDVSIEDLRRFCAERLPDFMVPSRFVKLDQLPRLPNGKVDRLALLNGTVQHEIDCSDVVSPRTETERILADVWCEVLGLDTVSVNDNFYEVGGDSILSIQVVSRARQQGVHIDPAHILDNRSIAQLAKTADGLVQKSARTVTGIDGPFPLSPIQAWFFAEIGAEPRWNQSRLLKLPVDVSPTRVEEVLDGILKRHVALRLRFPIIAGQRMQEISPPRDFKLDVVSVKESAAFEQQVVMVAERLHSSMDLNEGALFRAAFLRHGFLEGYLLLVAHHLIVDHVSWVLLTDEIIRGCQTTFVDELEPDHSYHSWSLENAAANLAPGELAFWAGQASSNDPSFLKAVRGTEHDTRRKSITLSSDVTAALLECVRKAGDIDVADCLLATLVAMVSSRTSQRRVRIGLEHHGRKPTSSGADVTTTIGWLTTFFPVEIDSSSAGGWTGLVQAVSTARNGIPRGGVGYCQILYGATLDTQARLDRPPLALLNYLGAVDSPSRPSVVALREIGRSKTSRRAFSLEINAYLAEGQLTADFIFAKKAVDENIADELPAEFAATIEVLTDELNAASGADSVFRDSGLGSEDLTRLMDRLSGND